VQGSGHAKPAVSGKNNNGRPMKKIRIKIGELNIDAVLNATKTAEAIYKALPFSAKANTWGDETYFTIPVKHGPENPKPVVAIGDLAYWMPGAAFCLFYGETPSSCKGEVRPASPVNVIGKFELQYVESLKKTKNGTAVTVEKLN